VQVNRTIVAGLAGALLLAGLVEAKVYRWVDESGKVVFSQTPPPGPTQAEEIEVNAPPPATPVETQKKQSEKEAAGNPALDPKLRKDYCEKGRKILQVLEEAGPDTVFITEDNKTMKLGPEERTRKTREAQAAVKAYCD